MRRILLVWIVVSISCSVQDRGPAEEEVSEVHQSWRTPDQPIREVGPPRKIIVGTVMQSFWEKFPLAETLDNVTALIDEVAEEGKRKYPDRGLDLVLVTESAVSLSGTSLEQQAVRLEGEVSRRFGAKARQHDTYLIIPMLLAEDKNDRRIYSNTAVLFDREGQVAGIYRKVHPVSDLHGDGLEGGVTPGDDYDVFDCDFGRLGIQICWDLSYEEGWRALAQNGAEIVALLSESPQLTRPSYYASKGGYWVVSSTPRHNASFFNPAGMIETQILEGDGRMLVHEIDLAFLVLPWTGKLEEGRLFERTFGERVGFRYYASEDKGVFWSNDSEMSVSQMAVQLGLVEFDWHVERTRILQNAARRKASTQ
jgi:predicted amidohydrolase